MQRAPCGVLYPGAACDKRQRQCVGDVSSGCNATRHPTGATSPQPHPVLTFIVFSARLTIASAGGTLVVQAVTAAARVRHIARLADVVGAGRPARANVAPPAAALKQRRWPGTVGRPPETRGT